MVEKRQSSKRSTVLHLVGTLLAIILLVFLFRQQGWDEILAAFRRIPFWRLVLAVTLTLVSRLAVTGRWHVLLVAAGVEIPFLQSLRITFAGLFASQFLPTTVGGDIVRLGGVVRLGYARAISVASLIVDRLIGMAGMAMAALSLLFQISSNQELNGDPLFIQKNIRFIINFFNPMFFLLSVQNPKHSRLGSISSKVLYYVRRLGSTLMIWKQHPRALLVSLAFTWIHMLCLFGSIWLFVEPLGEVIGFWMIAGLWSITYFVTLLPISVNGLGVQELSITFFYTQIGGLQLANALTIALLVRVIQMFASLPGALVIPGLLAGEKVD